MRVRELFSMAFIFYGLLAVSIFATPCTAEQGDDEAALKQRTAAFVEAVKSGDAKEVAGFWTDQGEYSDGDGVTLRGASDLEEAYRKHFQEVGKPEVGHEIDGIRFLSRDTAVVEGTFESTYAKEKKAKSAGFSILYVREDGAWHIAVLREWSRETGLRDLDWLIGNWSAKTEGGEVNSAYSWSDDKSVITMQFSVKAEKNVSSGREVIARDPVSGSIRSWVFAGGGIGEGFWLREGEKWVVRSSGLTVQGEEMVATNIFIPKGTDSFTFRSIDRTLDGNKLPDVGPMIVRRTK